MLLETYFEVYPDLKSSTNSVDEMIEMIISKQTLLEDYFSISLNDVEESLEALPVLIDQHQPNIFYLPEFIYRIINKVEWSDEKLCFKSFGKELARFYSYPPEIDLSSNEWSNLIENKIFPLYKNMLLPSKTSSKQSLHLITNINTLYKVFERC